MRAEKDHLYIGIGAPCNVPGEMRQDCMEPRDIMGTINAFGPLHDVDGRRVETLEGKQRVVAKGIRNTVGFTFHPETGALWFTENGSDNWPDPLGSKDYPPCELNVIPDPSINAAARDFGFQYCYGYNLSDPRFPLEPPLTCLTAGYEPAALEFPAHTAPLGMRISGPSPVQFPAAFGNRAFIAQHGATFVAEYTQNATHTMMISL
jgi:glucose/arabinose dehydrogenase